MNKEFFKSLFKGEKKVQKVTEVQHIIVPKLEELSIKAIFEMVKKDDVMK